MHDVTTLDFARIAQDLQIRKVQVESVVQLLDEGNTVPFITRYRKERTGGLNEEMIRQIQGRVGFLRQLAERKQTILKSIDNQGKLTDELRAAVLGAETSKRLEDLYLPYKPKKRTLASVARDRGLEPLALAVWNRDPAVANLNEVLPTMVNPEKELNSPGDVLAGVQHILAERIAETADVRAAVRSILWETGRLSTSKSENLADGQGLEYKDYFQFTEPVRQIPPHRILAINRGEKEGSLKVRLEWKTEAAQQAFFADLPGRPPLLPLADHPHADFLKAVAEDALSRLLLPSLERELRRELTGRAEDHAVDVFARNLRSLLLQPPLHGRRVLAIDPGFRTGCKVAALDEHGNLLQDAVIFPHPLHGKGHGKKAPPAPAAAAPAEPPETQGADAARSPQKETQGADAARSPQKDEPPPVPPRREEAKAKLEELVRTHQIRVIAIGNGTACRETEEFVSELITQLEARRAAPAGHVPAAAADVVTVPPAPVAGATPEPAEPPAPAAAAPSPPPPPTAAGPAPELAYVIVNEAGASVYSASAVGREEFPDYDATLRGTISIGRRLQDPLSELVKIDPQNIGVGLYQHDVNPRELKESLEAVIESSVNHVGVDLNTASVPLLRYVAGLNQLVARDVVDYRKQHGPFRSREQLLDVPNIGPARYVQAAGFLKIASGDNPLDQTWIHPESYPVARRLLAELGYEPDALRDRHRAEELRARLKALASEEVSARLEVGVPTLRDILEALARPGRDPREDLPPPIFKKGILKLEDLQPGMELKGTVLNVVDFGAFVDVGLKDSGLVHISQMANRYIKNPYDVVAVGDVVTVWVLTVDQERRRVSLTMIKPGTQRKPAERKPAPARAQRGSRPPRGRRPGPPHGPVAVPGQGPPPAGVAQEAHKPAGDAAAGPPPREAAPPPRPAPPPRRPKRHLPKPKLSQAALEGKAPLRTFSELKALYEAKQKEELPPKQAAAVQEAAPSPEASGSAS